MDVDTLISQLRGYGMGHDRVVVEVDEYADGEGLVGGQRGVKGVRSEGTGDGRDHVTVIELDAD
jgi:hypothetical protein